MTVSSIPFDGVSTGMVIAGCLVAPSRVGEKAFGVKANSWILLTRLLKNLAVRKSPLLTPKALVGGPGVVAPENIRSLPMKNWPMLLLWMTVRRAYVLAIVVPLDRAMLLHRNV